VGPSTGWVKIVGSSTGWVKIVGPSTGWVKIVGPSTGWVKIMGPSTGWVKPKIMKLVFTASIITQRYNNPTTGLVQNGPNDHHFTTTLQL
jgi:hypothetical protein